jgi:hypothetical protein
MKGERRPKSEVVRKNLKLQIRVVTPVMERPKPNQESHAGWAGRLKTFSVPSLLTSGMDADSPLQTVSFLTEKDAKFKKATNKRKKVGNRIRIGEKIAKRPRTPTTNPKHVKVPSRADLMAEESLDGAFDVTTCILMEKIDIQMLDPFQWAFSQFLA